MFVSHAISQAQDTTSCFLEFRPKPGYAEDQVLADLHSALASSPIVHCYEHPPFPKPSEIGQEECKALTLVEKAKLSNLARTGKLPLESGYDVQVENEEDGLIANSHADAPSGMPSSHVYCTYCDLLVAWNVPEEGRGRVNDHITTQNHQQNKACGGWEAFDIERLLEGKQKAVDVHRQHGIEMGDDPSKFHCSACNESYNCKRRKPMKNRVHGYRTIFSTAAIPKHIKTWHGK